MENVLRIGGAFFRLREPRRLAQWHRDHPGVTYPSGRFARLNGPEGNPIELWEPAGRDARQP